MKCPLCKSEMNLRNGYKGEYWRCSNPNCQKTFDYYDDSIIHVGATVLYYDEITKEEYIVTITNISYKYVPAKFGGRYSESYYKSIPVSKADPDQNIISESSELGKALLNKLKGQRVEFQTIAGIQKIKILDFKNKIDVYVGSKK